MGKFLAYQRDSLDRVDIATDEDGHVVRYIVGIEVILDVNQRRVLQVVNCPNCGSLPVGMNLI